MCCLLLRAWKGAGAWKTQDSQGKPFQIPLSPDGKAKGSLVNKRLPGTWKTEGDSAVIGWDSGWSATITKEGGK